MSARRLPVAADVHSFWFGTPPGKQRAEWFRKDDAFDGEIRRRFGDLHEAASRRELESWRAAPDSLVALVVVLDQFSRNLHRGKARAFDQDPYAREVAREALARGDDASRLPVERLFLYLPFEHSEDRADQELSVRLLSQLESFDPTRGIAQWALRHKAVIDRFGRFPHRNATLGRVSTPDELKFLETNPGF